MDQCTVISKVLSPESGYKHKSLMSVDGSMEVNGLPCQ